MVIFISGAASRARNRHPRIPERSRGRTGVKAAYTRALRGRRALTPATAPQLTIPNIRGMSSLKNRSFGGGGDPLHDRQPVRRRQMAISRSHRDGLVPRSFPNFLDAGPRHCQLGAEHVPVAMPDVAADACAFPARVKPRASIETLLPSRGKTGSEACCFGNRRDSMASIASELRWTVRADPFFVFVSSIVRRSRLTCDQVQVYCSLRRIPVCTLTTNSAKCSGKRLEMTLFSASYSSRLRKRNLLCLLSAGAPGG